MSYEQKHPFDRAREYYVSLFEDEIVLQDGRVDSEDADEREEALAARAFAAHMLAYAQALTASTPLTIRQQRDLASDRWLQTLTGAPAFLFAPEPGDIDIEVMAWALANLCRYNGHVRRYWSIGDHSLLVCQLLKDAGHGPEIQLAGLVHDGAEYVLGDVTRPLKRALPLYKVIENRWEQAIAEHVGLAWPWPDAVKWADNYALAIERSQLLAEPPRPWSEPEFDLSDVPVLLQTPPYVTRRRFVARYKALRAEAGLT